MNRDRGNTIEEIVAQQAVAYRIGRRPVRRADQTEIHGISLFRTDLAITSLLKNTQQLRLQLYRHLRNFVEHQRAAGSMLDQAFLVCVSAGEGAFGMSEQL